MFLQKYVNIHDQANGFPSDIKSVVNPLLSTVPHDLKYPRYFFIVNFNGEELHIPYRINCDPQWLRGALNSSHCLTQRNIINCLGTRHTNGFVRQEFLQKMLLEAEEPWITPYVIQLASEYVVEISSIVLISLKSQNVKVLREYSRENQKYFEKFESRVANYWSHYYRDLYVEKKDCPGSKVLDFIRSLENLNE